MLRLRARGRCERVAGSDDAAALEPDDASAVLFCKELERKTLSAGDVAGFALFYKGCVALRRFKEVARQIREVLEDFAKALDASAAKE